MIVDNKDRNYRKRSAPFRRNGAGTVPARGFGLRPTGGPARFCEPGLNNYSRPGATLLEVLVAIFIMGIGLIALLVLFPLGALTMAKAIRDERAAQAAVFGSSMANVANVRRDPVLYDAKNNIDLFYNPKPGLTQTDVEKKSFPVFVDPVGFYTAAGLASQDSVGNIPLANTNFLLRRTRVSYTPAPGVEVYKWFTFQDDIIFDKEGNAKITGVGPLIERDVRYSLAYLLQRPRTADPAVVECAVVVYDSRPVGLSGNLDLAEYPYYQVTPVAKAPEVAFDPAANLVRIRYGIENLPAAAPPIRSGDWVLDVSVIGGDPHAYFYRVAGVTEASDAVSAYVDLETQQPLRGFGNVAVDSTSGARLLFLEGVAEVFEHRLGKEPSTNP